MNNGLNRTANYGRINTVHFYSGTNGREFAELLLWNEPERTANKLV